MSKEIRQSILNNGLKIITAERPQLETVSLGVWVNTGAASESAEDNGISHFIEHMVFKGTKKRNARQISEDIENVGGATNAYTSRHFTCFYAKMLKDDLELATDVICDFITDPTFDNGEMTKEKEVVVQEIKQSIDAPDDLVFDYFQAAAFPHQAAGRTILGTTEQVRGFTRERMLGYMASHYTADNMIAVAVGKVDHDKFVKMIEERMGALPAHIGFTEEEQRYTGGGRVNRRIWCLVSAARPIWIRIITAIRCYQRFSAAACRRACFRKFAKSAGWFIPSAALTRRLKTPACSEFTPEQRPKSLMNCCRWWRQKLKS